MKIISSQNLVQLLLSQKGATFATVVTSTEPSMNKKNRDTGMANPFLGRRVRRVADRRVMLGASYENAVKNRREREGHDNPSEFRAESLWNGAGESVEGSRIVVRHRTTGKLYVVFYPYRSDSVAQDLWTVDGTTVPVSELAPYLPPPARSSGRQETENPVAWRVVALENIAQVTMNGETLTIAH